MADEMHPDERPHVVERCQTELGELVLRRCGNHHELISDGMFVMDTRDGRSERALLEQALAVAPPRPRVVIGGLGFGFSLEAAVASAAPTSIVVVEVHRQIIEWNRAHLPERTSRTMADPRVRVVCADVGEWLDRNDSHLDVVCLDIDNGPGWFMLPRNEAIYSDARLARIGKRLGDRGVLAVWSADLSPAFEGALRRSFDDVATHEIPVARGAPDIVYIARRPL
ncbi:MAG: spermidine synthase [Pseudonocardiales bacterium]|nr:spermidine synthase [Pseudonocardiales bacterium]